MGSIRLFLLRYNEIENDFKRIISQGAAKRLAYAAGAGDYPVGPDYHGKKKGDVGYFWHYHAHRHKSGHIFYVK